MFKDIKDEIKFQVSKKRNAFQPVFLIGCGRSGTTILGTTIGKHESITYLNERRDLWHQAYPEFDICENYLNEKFDLIIADNVWEHLKYPYKASKNIQKMLNKNGYFLVIVPFLVRLHEVPIDCTRWTEDGLKYYLEESGFNINNIETGSWGNKKSVISNLRNDDKWTRVGFYSKLNNEKNFPVQIWALAKI